MEGSRRQVDGIKLETVAGQRKTAQNAVGEEESGYEMKSLRLKHSGINNLPPSEIPLPITPEGSSPNHIQTTGSGEYVAGKSE
jgi:hypothetical protein